MYTLVVEFCVRGIFSTGPLMNMNEHVLSFRVPTYIHIFLYIYIYVIIHIKCFFSEVFFSEVFSLMCPIYWQNASSFLDRAGRASFIGTPCICAGLAPCIWTSKPLSFLHLPLLDMSDPIWHSISYPIPIVGNQDTFMRECGYRIIITVRPPARLPHTPSSFLPCTLVKGTLLALTAIAKFKSEIHIQTIANKMDCIPSQK